VGISPDAWEPATRPAPNSPSAGGQAGYLTIFAPFAPQDKSPRLRSAAAPLKKSARSAPAGRAAGRRGMILPMSKKKSRVSKRQMRKIRVQQAIFGMIALIVIASMVLALIT
jgi:hypothetical protein